MSKVEKFILIKASPEKVWEMLALDRLPEWTEGYQESAEYTSEVNTLEDKFRVGASAHTNMKGTGAMDFEITESL